MTADPWVHWVSFSSKALSSWGRWWGKNGGKTYSHPPGNKYLCHVLGAMKRGSGHGDPDLGLRKAWRNTQWKALLQRRAWTARQPVWPHGEHGEPGQPQWPQEGGRTFFQVQWRAGERFQAVRTGSDGYFKEITFVRVCLVTQSCPTPCDPMDWAHQAPLSMGILQATILVWVAMPSSRVSSQPGDWTRSPALQANSLPAELSGKAEITFINTNTIFIPPMLYWVGHDWSNLVVVGVCCIAEKAGATHSSALAWKIPWMEEPGGLQSMWSVRVGHDWAISLSLFTFMHWRRKWQPTPVFLPGEFQGQRSLVGCRLWGRTESDTTEAT